MTTLSKAEQETHLTRMADETEWTIYCTDPAALPHFLKLAKQVGGRVIQDQGGTKIFLPVDAIHIGLKRKYKLTQEQRAERSKEMKTRRRDSRPLGKSA